MTTIVLLIYLTTNPPGFQIFEMPTLRACDEVGKWIEGARAYPKVKWTCMELPDEGRHTFR